MFLDILGVTLRNSPNMLFSDFQASVLLFLSFRILNYSLLSLHIPLFFPLIILPIFPSLQPRICFPPLLHRFLYVFYYYYVLVLGVQLSGSTVIYLHRVPDSSMLIS